MRLLTVRVRPVPAGGFSPSFWFQAPPCPSLDLDFSSCGSFPPSHPALPTGVYMCSLGGVCCSEELAAALGPGECVTGETEGLRERLLSPGSQGGRSRGPGDRDEEAEGWPDPIGGIPAVQPAVPGMAQTRGSPLPTVHQA